MKSLRTLMTFACLAAWHLSAAAQETTLRLVSAFPENGVYVSHLLNWVKQVNDRGKVSYRSISSAAHAQFRHLKLAMLSRQASSI